MTTAKHGTAKDLSFTSKTQRKSGSPAPSTKLPWKEARKEKNEGDATRGNRRRKHHSYLLRLLQFLIFSLHIRVLFPIPITIRIPFEEIVKGSSRRTNLVLREEKMQRILLWPFTGELHNFTRKKNQFFLLKGYNLTSEPRSRGFGPSPSETFHLHVITEKKTDGRFFFLNSLSFTLMASGEKGCANNGFCVRTSISWVGQCTIK